MVPNTCSGLPAFTIPATSNFFAGFRVVDTTSVSPTCFGKTLTCHEQQQAAHGILPPQRTTPPHEGVIKFIDPRCVIVGTPAIAAACGGTYCGDNTKPLCNSCLCPELPMISPIGIEIVVLLLVLAGIAALVFRKRQTPQRSG